MAYICQARLFMLDTLVNPWEAAGMVTNEDKAVAEEYISRVDKLERENAELRAKMERAKTRSFWFADGIKAALKELQ